MSSAFVRSFFAFPDTHLGVPRNLAKKVNPLTLSSPAPFAHLFGSGAGFFVKVSAAHLCYMSARQPCQRAS